MCNTLGHELHKFINSPGLLSLGSQEEGDNLARHLVKVPDVGGLYFFLDEFLCHGEARFQRIAHVGKAESLRERFLWHLSSDQTPWYRQGKVRSVFR